MRIKFVWAWVRNMDLDRGAKDGDQGGRDGDVQMFRCSDVRMFSFAFELERKNFDKSLTKNKHQNILPEKKVHFHVALIRNSDFQRSKSDFLMKHVNISRFLAREFACAGAEA